MDMSYTDAEQTFRRDVRTFLRDQVPEALARKVRLGQHLDKADYEQ